MRHTSKQSMRQIRECSRIKREIYQDAIMNRDCVDRADRFDKEISKRLINSHCFSRSHIRDDEQIHVYDETSVKDYFEKSADKAQRKIVAILLSQTTTKNNASLITHVSVLRNDKKNNHMRIKINRSIIARKNKRNYEKHRNQRKQNHEEELTQFAFRCSF